MTCGNFRDRDSGGQERKLEGKSVSKKGLKRAGAELQDLLGHPSTGEGGGWLRLNQRNKRGGEEMMVRTSDGCVWNETRQEYDVTSSSLPGTFSCQDTGQNWW